MGFVITYQKTNTLNPVMVGWTQKSENECDMTPAGELQQRAIAISYFISVAMY
jgi:hypothetical protein